MERQIRGRNSEAGNQLKVMKRVLVTGAKGFVGHFCLPLLAAKGYEVHAISRTPPINNKNSQEFDIRWHQADLLDAAQTAQLVAAIHPTHLLHLAWHIEHGKHYSARENFLWVCTSLTLFEDFVANGGQRAVCAGTAAEYSWTEETIYEEYRTPLKPATAYGKCKHALQILLEAYAQQFGVSFAWGRIFFLYGPEDRTNRLVPSVIRDLLQKNRRCVRTAIRLEIFFILTMPLMLLSLCLTATFAAQ
jgi:nucleoside-diphosphate-sugar epimerase